MLPEPLDLLLCALVLASGVACIASDYANRRVGVYFFKPLTMLLILALAVQPSSSTTGFYRGAILAGLLFSLAGDVLLMLPSDRFAAGLASFLVAHLLYIAAFASDTSPTLRATALLPFLLVGAGVTAWLWTGLGKLRIPVLLYVLAIVTMAWQAVERSIQVGQLGALIACLGAILFVASDAALAVNRFRRPFRAAQAVVLGTYFPAQLLIALSIGAGESLVDWIIR